GRPADGGQLLQDGRAAVDQDGGVAGTDQVAGVGLPAHGDGRADAEEDDLDHDRLPPSPSMFRRHSISSGKGSAHSQPASTQKPGTSTEATRPSAMVSVT